MTGTKRSAAALERLRQRSRWNEEDARVVLAELERSGVSVSAFASEQELPANRLYYWRDRLREDASTDVHDEAKLSFAPVVVTGLGRKPAVTVRLGDLEVDVFEPEKVEPAWLARLWSAATEVG